MSDEVPLPAAEPGTTDDVRAREMSTALRNGLKMGLSLLVTWSVAMIVKLRVPAHLGPVRQGHFGFAESFATMFFAVTSLGIDTHLIKEVAVRPKYASSVVGGVLTVRAFMSALIFVVMAVVLWVTGRSGELFFAALVFGAINVTSTLNGTLGTVLQAVSRVGPAVIANVAAKLLWAAGLLVGLHYDASLGLLALPGLAGELLRTAIILPAAQKLAGLTLKVDLQETRAALRESIPYFVNALALSVLSSLGMSVLEFVSADEREVGWFAAVQNIAYLCTLLSPLLFWVVMPLLSRAEGRSKEEGMTVFRRCLEGIVVTIVPITVLISAGSDVLIQLAFGARYAPARLGLSILSLVFIMTYMNTMFAMHLTILGKGWSVTLISVSAVFITAGLIFVFVPLGGRLIGEGGQCAGAAMSVIVSEACTLVFMLGRFDRFPLDARNVRVTALSIGIAGAVLVADHFLRGLGMLRLPIDGALYLVGALALRVVHPGDIANVVRLLRNRNATPPLTSTLAQG